MYYDKSGKNSRDPITVGVNNLHFVDWTTGVPKVLGVEDFSRVMESGGLFARKFDITEDAAILDMIDERLGIGPFSDLPPST